MIPNKELIDGLRKTADILDHSVDYPYNWSEPSTCNCGVLAQVLLDMNQRDIKHMIIGDDGHPSPIWSDAAKSICPTTGLPTSLIIRALGNFGIQPHDYFDIEYAGTNTFDKDLFLNQKEDGLYRDRYYVANYMRQQAALLEQRLLNKEITPLTQTQGVSV